MRSLNIKIADVDLEVTYETDSHGGLDHIRSVFCGDQEIWDLLSSQIEDEIRQAVYEDIESQKIDDGMTRAKDRMVG